VPKRCHGDQQKWLKHVRETGRPPILRKASEGTILKKDGSESPVEVSTAIWAARDQPFLTVILRDTSERKKMEEELIKTSKLESLGILAGGIAHDFNNILTALLGNVSIAKTSVNPEDSLFKRLTEAEKACLRAKDLTQQLLTFSKGGTPIKKTVSLGELLKESADFALRGSNVRCEFSIAEDLWPVEIDEGQINQVINNLIINADQAMPEGGTIEIHAENTLLEAQDGLLLPEGKYVKISIKDQGVGIPREYLIKIFDPYFTTKYKGSGLGLSTSYSIIKNHDGHIDVESQLGVGTIFTIHLPASKKKIPAMKRFKETPISGKGRILVMDDEETIRNLLFDMLKDLGYEVELVKDGNETIESYKKARYSGHPFDAVIMDLTIPGGMGGKEAIKILREIDPQLKAIVSSGFSNDPIMSDFHKYGFKGVIAKPYNVEDMSRILHRVITGK
jgi:signal transduction histidine kinase/ActR/RegA family two-component response regulator